MNNKKSIKFVLAIATLLSGVALASCGGGNDGSSSSEAPTSSVQEAPQSFSGIGAPDATLGKDGDEYTDTSTGDHYTKMGGAWVLDQHTSAHYEGVGAPNAEMGYNGDTYTDTSTGNEYTKQNGVWVKTKEGKDDSQKVTVMFDLDGGLMNGKDSTVDPQKIDYGGFVLDPGTPTKDHCSFIGWYVGSAKWDFATPVYKDLTLVAKYSVNEDEKVTITIDPGNGAPTYEVETFEGDSPRLEIPQMDGYSFAGWYIDGNKNTPWTGTVRSSELTGHVIKALFEKANFNFRFVVNEDDPNTVTITGLLNIDTVTADIPSSIGGKTVTAIGETAFQSRISLMQVIIPATVKTINPRAFLGARKLTTITVSANNQYYKSVDGILYSRDGTTLVFCPQKNFSSSFTVPSGVKKIGDYAFYGQADEGISGITFPEGLEEIGNRAFYGMSNSSFTSLSFPDSLKKIGDYAFAYVASSSEGLIQQITWGTGLEEIGYAAFFGQYFKGTLTLPEGLKKIGERAFSNCSAIERLVLPSTIEYLAPGFAAYAQGIGEIKIAGDENANYKVVDNTLYTKDGSILVYSPANRVDLSEITVPAGVTQIADYAFYCNKFVRSIVLPNSVTSLGKESFREVYLLASFVIPNSVTTMGEDCFSGCSALTSLTIGSGLTSIARYAISETGLAEITIPATVKKIEDSAFYGNTKLAYVNFNEGLEEIGGGAFYVPERSGDEESSVSTTGKIVSLTFPKSLTKIGSYAFANQTSLTSVRFGNIQEIGEGAFSGASSLQSVRVQEGMTDGAVTNSDNTILYTAGYKKIIFAAVNALDERAALDLTGHNETEEIAPYVFAGAKKITSIKLPTSLIKIGEGAFYSSVDYTNATDWTLSIPASLQEIGDSAFEFTNHLTAINFEGESHLNKIGEEAFAMTDITSLSLPNSVQVIGDSAFAICNKMTSINLGNGLKEIGEGAFNRCTGLKNVEITLPASLEKLGANAFGDTGAKVSLAEGNANLVLENGLIMNKDKDTVISYVGGDGTVLALPSTVKTIADYAFSGVTKLTRIVLNDGLLAIGEYAFSGCTSITTLSIPSSVVSIGYRAFNSWQSAQTIKFSISQEAAASKYGDDYLNSCRATMVYGA